MPAWRLPTLIFPSSARLSRLTRARTLLCGLALAGATSWAGAYAFPSTVLDRTGFEDLAKPNDTCCQTRLVGWNAEGQIATTTAEYLPEQGMFRFGVDFHDLLNDQPRGLFERKYFRADPIIEGACAKSKDLLRCLWKENQAEIAKELASAGINQGFGQKLLPLPRHTIEWTADADLSGESAPFSISDSAQRLVFHMVDSAAGGLHLVPYGMLGDRAGKRRWLVLRLSRRELLDAPMTVLGIRFLKLEFTR
ncbi:MAG: hypothetical protein IPK50_03210 [Fibrobacterota bacterium]|nr:hypothetical protein [Fibrobacterota bacterium]QQS05905.1 MAG: hypothetical protein IPK50_03210 [Fibrobacterota bacterium]